MRMFWPRPAARWLLRSLPATSFALLLCVAQDARAQERGTNETPLRRAEFFEQQRAYPFTRIPPGALQRATRELLARWPDAQIARSPLRAADQHQATTGWTALGPAPIADRAAGRISTIAIAPTRPEVIYIGGAQGGVWRTDDGGQSWLALTDGECSLAMGSIALDPVAPDIVYAGTGELHFSGDSYYGCGLLRSLDGGVTWSRSGANEFDTNTGGARISKVIVDQATAGTTGATTVYVASSFGVYRSTDSGNSWTRVLNGIATDLVVDPVDPRILFAALGSTADLPTNGVYKSFDGGSNWTRLTGGFPSADVGRISLAIAPSAREVLYAAVQNAFQTPRAPGDGQLLGIWKSTNGGAAWSRLSATNASCGNQCWYDLVIAVHPADPQRVYFGGVSIYRSITGGNSFSSIQSGIHVDHHAIAFDPLNPAIMYSGNDGGIYRSANGGSSWTSINGNLQITQFYSGVSLHPVDVGRVLGGTQDNGTLESDGTPEWQPVLGADGGFTAIDARDPNIAYAETQWTAGSSFSGPRRRDGPGPFTQRKATGIDLTDRALFIPPMVMDPVETNVLYFGTYRLYRTTDRAELWAPISDNLSRTGNGSISAIAPAESDRNTIYVGTSDGALQVTADGGETWANRSAGLPDRYITNIAVDAFDASRAIVTVSGFGTGHVFRTADAGRTWQDVSGDLPDVPVNAVLAAPAMGDVIHIGTDLGVFRSDDGGQSWIPFNENLPNVAVFDLAYSRSTGLLVAATHGRGAFGFTPVLVAHIAIATDSLSFQALGDTARLEATATNAQGQPVEPFTPLWESQNPAVASVDARGLVRATGNGTTGIIATLTGRSDTVAVRVRQVVVAVAGLPDTATLVVGENRQLVASPVDANGEDVSDVALEYTSSSDSVALVDAAGLLSATRVGTTTITASTGSFRDTLAVRVAPPAIVVLGAQPATVDGEPLSAAGTLMPLLRLHLSVNGIEPVLLTRIGFTVEGDDPAASLVLIRDGDGDGVIGSGDTPVAAAPVLLRPDEPTQVALEVTALEVPVGASLQFIVAVRTSGAAPNGAAFRATFLPAQTRSSGARSGAADQIEQPSQPVASAVIRSTVLTAGQTFSMSENPVRSGGVTFNFPTRPAVAGIYTLTGRLVVNLVGRLSSDASVRWDLTNSSGTSVGPGVYLLVFEVDGRVVREKLIVLRAGADEDFSNDNFHR